MVFFAPSAALKQTGALQASIPTQIGSGRASRISGLTLSSLAGLQESLQESRRPRESADISAETALPIMMPA